MKFGSVLADYREYLIYSSSCAHETKTPKTQKIHPSKWCAEWKTRWALIRTFSERCHRFPSLPRLCFTHPGAPLRECVCVFSMSALNISPLSYSVSLSLLHFPPHIRSRFVMQCCLYVVSPPPPPPPPLPALVSPASLCCLFCLFPTTTPSPLRTLSHTNSAHLANLQNDPLLFFPANEWLIASSNYLNAQQLAEQKKCVQ